MPEDVRRWLERCLTENGFSGYEALEAACHAKGYEISKSAIHRYGQKIERKMERIKAGTEMAQRITELAGDDMDARSEALLALTQTEMFDAALAMQELGDEDVDPAERLQLMAKVSKSIASVVGASVRHKNFKVAARSRFEKIDAEVGAGRISAEEALRRVREEVYGI